MESLVFLDNWSTIAYPEWTKSSTLLHIIQSKIHRAIITFLSTLLSNFPSLLSCSIPNSSCSPGTARYLRGMALSMEGSEPIQSAWTFPIPAGLVLMSLSRLPANVLVRKLFFGTNARLQTDHHVLPVGNNHTRSSWNVAINLLHCSVKNK